MEIYAVSSAVMGTANSSLGKAFTNYCYSKWMGWRLKKRLHAVVLLKGVSTLCQKYSSPDNLFLDVDVIYEQLTAPKDAESVGKKPTVLESFMAYPIIRNHLYSVSRVFKKNIICVSHSHELLQALSISPDNIWFYAFSKEMDERTLPLFNGAETQHAESVVNKLRTRDRFDENKIVVVESMADLETKIKLKFGILQTQI
jgi:hypothetical protein